MRSDLSVLEGNLLAVVREDVRLGDGDPEEIGSEVLEGVAAIADALAVHDPGLFPDLGGHPSTVAFV